MTIYLFSHGSQPADFAQPSFQYVRRPGFLEIRTPGRSLTGSYLTIVCVIHLVVSGAIYWDRDRKCWDWTPPKCDALVASVKSVVNQPLPWQTDWRALLVGLPTEKLRKVRFVVCS
jgi:hypothetical protein